MDQGLERTRDEFQPISRYRSRYREWSVDRTLLSELGLRGVDRSAGIMH